MKKILCRIKGGLGNQLYCYAAARHLALANDAELIIDNVTGFKRDDLYNRKYRLDRFAIPCRIAEPSERFSPFERQRRAIAKLLARRKPFELRNYIEQEFPDLDKRLINLKIINHKTTIDGLWQSEAYFKNVAETIRLDLRIQPPIDKMNIDAMNWISAHNTVAIHVRWFGDQKSSANVPLSYYESAIKNIRDKIDNPYFVLFSDDTKSAALSLNLNSSKLLKVDWNIHDGGEVDDLWLMTHCKNFIIANSTFSWWGAWLGAASSDQLVMFPRCLPRDKYAWAWDYLGQMPTDWHPVHVLS